MYCTNCGNEIDENVIYCPQCGNKQSDDKFDNNEWYCIIGNVRKGPYKKDEVVLEIRKGNITRDSLVWEKGMQNWMSAGESSLSYIFQSSVPKLPNEIVDNRFVWALATVPIFVSWIIEGLFVLPELTTLVTVILNIVFITLDVNTLAKAEKNAKSWLWLGVVLVPLYLFIRASKTDKKYSYAITWCAMFLVDLIV